jgi:hypothetical protein
VIIIDPNIIKAVQNTEATGFEKAVNVVGDGVDKLRIKLSEIFEGKPRIISNNATGSRFANPLDKGLVPLTRELSSIDLCNVITYLINKTQDLKLGEKKSGEPNKPNSQNVNKPVETVFERKLSFVKNKAYEIQTLIDNHRNVFGTATGADARAILSATIQGINEILIAGENSVQAQLNDPEIQKVFPQVVVFNNFFSNVSGFFQRFQNSTEIPVSQVKKIMSYVDKLRSICVAIQGLDSFAAVFQLANGFVGGKLTQEIEKLNKIVKPDKLLPLIKNVQKACISLQQICKLLITYIETGRRIVSLLLGIFNVLRIIKNFMLAIPIPGVFTTVGINNLFSDVVSDKITKFLDQMIKRLGQINAVLNNIVAVISYVIIQIDEVLRYVRIIISNLENCDNVDADIVKDLKDVVKDLETSRNTLIAFRDNYLNKKNAIDSTYGDRKNKFSIRVVEEKVTDINITLKRRYGIAINANNQIVVESTPTFASDTSIIVNEVKVLLVSKGLVNPELSQLSAKDLTTINESMNFLEGETMSLDEALANTYSFDALENSDKYGLDSPENENEDQENLGLNAFINKIRGGKKLRNKMRKLMAAQLAKTSSQLKSAEGGTAAANQFEKQASYQNSRISKENSTDNKKEINDLKKRKDKLQRERNTYNKLPKINPIISAKIKKLDKEIKKIEEEIQELQK